MADQGKGDGEWTLRGGQSKGDGELMLVRLLRSSRSGPGLPAFQLQRSGGSTYTYWGVGTRSGVADQGKGDREWTLRVADQPTDDGELMLRSGPYTPHHTSIA